LVISIIAVILSTEIGPSPGSSMRINSSLSLVGSGQFALSGPFDCHVYGVRCPEGIVLIDCGSGLHEEEIVQRLVEDFPGEAVAAIIVTHSHMDHSGGTAALKARFKCSVLTSALTASILRNADEDRNGLKLARERGTYPLGIRMTPCEVETTYEDGERIRVAGRDFGVLRVRGHSEDSFCLLTEMEDGLGCFSADCVFYGGVLGVINAEDSGMQGYCKDLHKLGGLGVDLLLPGHGMFTLKHGQKHIDSAIEGARKGFLYPQIGQGATIF
jgi:glyoxylase-like metal-dependent hydrolase (beta-lactamase superfamily II)